jgi:hypothetical protein
VIFGKNSRCLPINPENRQNPRNPQIQIKTCSFRSDHKEAITDVTPGIHVCVIHDDSTWNLLPTTATLLHVRSKENC